MSLDFVQICDSLCAGLLDYFHNSPLLVANSPFGILDNAKQLLIKLLLDLTLAALLCLRDQVFL